MYITGTWQGPAWRCDGDAIGPGCRHQEEGLWRVQV